MSNSVSATMVPPMNRTEHELRSLLSAVRIRLADAVYASGHGRDWVSDILAAAPVESCVRLASAWNTAQDGGMALDRFTAEERLILEMVETVYSSPRTAPGTDAVFARLMGELDAAEAA